MVWVVFFIISAAIRLIAFKSDSLWFDIPAEISLWAATVLFTLASSEATYGGPRVNQTMTKTDDPLEYRIKFQVLLTEDPRFTPKYVYLFFWGMACWILALLLSQQAARLNLQPNKSVAMRSYLIGSFATAILAVILAMSALFSANAPSSPETPSTQ